jgi:Fe2+ or Zn2+ uptake regulation protein
MNDCVVGDFARDLSLSTGYQIQGHWLEFYGTCNACPSSRPAPAAVM